MKEKNQYDTVNSTEAEWDAQGTTISPEPSAEDQQGAKETPSSAGRIQRKSGSFWSSRVFKYGVWTGSGVVILLIWEAISRTGQGALLLAGPDETLTALIGLISQGTLFSDLAVTGAEFVISFGMAIVFGIAVGVGVGYYPLVAMSLRPWIAAGYSTPLIALTPLFILWFGIGIWSKVAVGFIVMFFPILVNTALGVSSADKGLIEMMRSLSATQGQIIRKAILRGSIPHIITGFRLAVGRGLTALVGAELLGATAGVGYRILNASQSFDTATLLANVVVLAVIGAALMTSLEALDKRVAEHRAA